MSKQKVIERIQKLLAFKQQDEVAGGTPQQIAAREKEAVAATELIQKLMTEYNLSPKEVEETSQQKVACAEVDSDAPEWKLELLTAIADANYCRAFRAFTEPPSLIVLGREVNALSTTLLYKYLIEAVDRIIEQVNIQRRWHPSYLEGFREGVLYRLKQRITQQARQVSNDGITVDGQQVATGLACRAMAQNLQAEIDLVLESATFMETEKPRTPRILDATAFLDGFDVADQINLARQVRAASEQPD